MVPYMDIWAISAIYLALVSCRVKNQELFSDWLEKWFLVISETLEDFKIRMEIKDKMNDNYYSTVNSKKISTRVKRKRRKNLIKLLPSSKNTSGRLNQFLQFQENIQFQWEGDIETPLVCPDELAA